MGLPIVQEIWDGIRWLIDQFTDKAPRPLQIIIFLLFLLTIVNIVVWFFNISGLHCNSSKEVVKVDAIDIVTNVKIMFAQNNILTGETEQIKDVHPYAKFIKFDSAIESCTWYMKNVSGRFTICDTNETDCKYYYRDASCHDCDPIDVGWVYAPNTLLNWYYVGDVCGDGAGHLEKSWFQRNVVCEALCEIPIHYIWNYTLGVYQCNDDYCGTNASQSAYTEIDEMLHEAGGEKLYTNIGKDDYRRFISISCSDNYNPQISLLARPPKQGIEIFSFKLWLFLILIYIIFMFLGYITSHAR